MGKDWEALMDLPVWSRGPSFAVTDARGRFRLGGLEEGVVTVEAVLALYWTRSARLG